MATGSRLGPPPQDPEYDGPSPLRIYGIKEMPSGQDEELAALFRDLRRALDASQEDIASRLETDVEVVRALEDGALLALPPFAETSRIVIAYTSLLGLDARPILRRIHGQLVSRVTQHEGPNAPAAAPASASPRPQAAPPAAPRPQQPRAPGAMGQVPGGQRPAQRQGPMPQGQGQRRAPPQGAPRPDDLGAVRPLREPQPQARQRPRPPQPGQAREPAQRARPAGDPSGAPLRPSPVPDAEVAYVEDAYLGDHDATQSSGRFGGVRRWLRRYGLYAASGLVTLTVLTLLIASPNTVITTLEGLPQPFPMLADGMRAVIAPDQKEDGSQLPEDDPRSRKEDRLPGPPGGF